MQYLYKGSTDELSVESTDILELMAAANFFQLDGLLHYCEVRCASLIDLDNIVSYYIHAKVESRSIAFLHTKDQFVHSCVLVSSTFIFILRPKNW